jgi:hypothetical protein
VTEPPRPGDFEKLGAFYLGKAVERGGALSAAPLLYDSRDLTTHAVIVGMTGSGKTGLGITLLEEAAIDGIPAIAIDPKGDLGNLMLAFPALRPEEFRPWIDEGEAARAGVTPEAYAAQTAETWKSGLAAWGEDGDRVKRFRDAARARIVTPGSRAGLPLSILRSLAAPPEAAHADADLLRERVAGTVAGLLALVGVDSDPIRGRESILLATLLATLWKDGRDASLGDLVRGIEKPPFERVGVLDLEAFYPMRERAGLAVALNNLLASPGFTAWTEGEPLDARTLLYDEAGRPRLSIVSIAHLSDAERMFFVTLLLNDLIGWMRARPGTGSLRAILYMDEVFGFFPPTANPPAKTPMLTLLKQARAFGLGVVLATQNPVDLDYKGLANAGTWFLGRLQTERDKARVLDGLEGASASSGARFDRSGIEATLGGLKSRTFLMSNAHEDAPILFQTRWTLSYLRGPLTRPQIQQLMGSAPQGASRDTAAAPASAAAPADAGSDRPVLPPEANEQFAAAGGLLQPALLATAKLHYVDAKSGLDAWQTLRLLAPLGADRSQPSWSDARDLGASPPVLAAAPPAEARFAPIAPLALRARSYAEWRKSLSDYLYQERGLTLRRCAPLKMMSRPGESAADFAIRLRDAWRAQRDHDVEALRARYAPRLASLHDRLTRTEQRVERERSQFDQATVQTAISVGATVLGALFGRKTLSAGTIGRATTAMRGAGRSMREHGDIGQAQESAESVRQQIQDLEAEARTETDRLQGQGDPPLEEIAVTPRKSDIAVESLALVWIPTP